MPRLGVFSLGMIATILAARICLGSVAVRREIGTPQAVYW